MPRFKLLPKVHSLRLAGKRYFPGDEFELTEEQAERLNSDTFIKAEPSPTAVAITPEVSSVQPIQEPQAKPQLEATTSSAQKAKKSGKRPAFAGTNKP